jgi:multidrug efflux pump
MLTATFLAIFMIPMFFVVIRAKFGGEKEDPDEALRHYEQHHPHDPQGGAAGGSAEGPDSNGSGKDGH